MYTLVDSLKVSGDVWFCSRVEIPDYSLLENKETISLVTLFIAMLIMFSTYVTSKFTSPNQELFRSGLHPKPHWPFRGPGKRFLLIPEGHLRPTPFYLPWKVTSCLSDKEKVGTCFDHIAMTFFTREVVIGSECCDAINKMTTDCEKTVFGSFRSPILTGYVKLHYSTVVGSTSPDPLLSPSPAPLHAPSPAPVHAPLHASSPAPVHAPLHAPLHSSSPAPSHAPLDAPSPALSPAILSIY